MIRAAYVESRSWKQELHRYLRQYRATPHVAIGVPPAEALYGRKLRTTLPSLSQPLLDHQAVHEKVKVTDRLYKDKAKSYSDARRNAKSSSLKRGDTVLVRQRPSNKLATPFDPRPLVITKRNGSMVTASRGNYSVTRNISHFKPYKTFLSTEDLSDDPPLCSGPPTERPADAQLRSCLKDSNNPRPTHSRRLPVRFEEFVGLPASMTNDQAK